MEKQAVITGSPFPGLLMVETLLLEPGCPSLVEIKQSTILYK